MAGGNPKGSKELEKQLEEFRAFVTHRQERVRDLAEAQERKIIGYMSTTTPVEIIHAFGLHPVRLLSSRAGITEAGAKLQNFACSIPRSILDQGLKGELNYLSGIVIPRNTCDSVLHLADIWQRSIQAIPVHSIAQPVRTTGEAVQRFYTSELAMFAQTLGDAVGTKLTASALRKSINAYAENRKGLRTLGIMRSQRPEILPFSEYYSIVLSSQLMPVEEHTKRVRRLLDRIGKNKQDARQTGTKQTEIVPIIVSGGMVEGLELFEWLEECGGTVVADETSFGSRAIETRIDQRGLKPTATLPEYYGAIAKAYLEKTPDPTRFDHEKRREAKLITLLKDTGAKGVLFIHQQFCEAYAFDYVLLQKRLKAMNIPSVLLEIEHQLTNLGQLKTKLQTFVEMLK